MREMYLLRIKPKIDSGEYRLSLIKLRQPDQAYAHELAPGTQSAYYEVIDLAKNKSIMEGHRYVGPNQEELTGHPMDPKTIVMGYVTYQVQPKPFKGRR